MALQQIQVVQALTHVINQLTLLQALLHQLNHALVPASILIIAIVLALLIIHSLILSHFLTITMILVLFHLLMALDLTLHPVLAQLIDLNQTKVFLQTHDRLAPALVKSPILILLIFLVSLILIHVLI